MAERSLFFNAIETSPGVFDKEYQAQDFTDYLKGVATTGILRDPDNVDGLKVSVVSSSMDINIAEGLAYVEGHYYEIYNEPLKLTLNTPEPQYDRIDRIVLRLDLRLSGRHVKAFVKEGVSAASPVAPELERSELVYELSLAQIRVRKNTSSLQASDVTDERGDPDLCPWVSSKIIPNYNDDTLQAVLDGVQANDTKIDNHIKNFVQHTYYGTTGGNANAKTVNFNPAPTSLIDGMAVVFKNTLTNTGAVTLNVSGRGAKPLRKSNGEPLLSGDLVSGSIYTARYNSTSGNFILQGESGVKLPSWTKNKVLEITPYSYMKGNSYPKVHSHGAVIVGGKLYITGGYNERDNILGYTYVIDIATGDSETFNRPNSFEKAFMTNVGDDLFAVGHYGVNARIYKFVTGSNNWTSLYSGSDVINRNTILSISFGNFLYFPSAGKRFNILTNTWTNIAIKQVRAITKSDNDIYLFGGRTLTKLSPGTLTYTTLGEVSGDRAGTAISYLNNKIYFMGGARDNRSQRLPLMEYDVNSKVQKDLDSISFLIQNGVLLAFEDALISYGGVNGLSTAHSGAQENYRILIP